MREGDVVVDVGCGTGLSFEALLQRVGKRGRLIAFEQSPEMHDQAALRADSLRRAGWQIDLMQANAESVRFPVTPTAVLMHYVHDITRTPQALDNLFSQWPAGTRIAVAGMKFFPWYLAPLNLLAWLKNRPYNVRAHELRKPWTLLEARLDDFEWEPTQWGMGYLGSGRVASKGMK